MGWRNANIGGSGSTPTWANVLIAGNTTGNAIPVMERGMSMIDMTDPSQIIYITTINSPDPSIGYENGYINIVREGKINILDDQVVTYPDTRGRIIKQHETDTRNGVTMFSTIIERNGRVMINTDTSSNPALPLADIVMQSMHIALNSGTLPFVVFKDLNGNNYFIIENNGVVSCIYGIRNGGTLTETNIRVLDSAYVGNYNIANEDYIILCKDVNRSLYLPQGTGSILGKVYKIFNSSGITSTIYPYSGENISGNTSYTLLPYNSVTLQLLELGAWYIA